jgi:putative inorganic carbon (HCO3(-)) transporter
MITVRKQVDRLLLLTVPKPKVPLRWEPAIWPISILLVGILLAWLPLKIALATVGAVIFFMLALFQPVLTLFLLIPVIPFSSVLTFSAFGARAGAMELLLLLAVALWLLHILTNQTLNGRPLLIHTGPLLWPFTIFLGGIYLSWLNALSIRASLIETIKWVEVFFLYLFIINLMPPRYIKWTTAIILFTGMAQAVLGLYQFIFKVGPEGFLLFGGDFLRAYGTFAQPNPYAGYLGLVLPLAVSLLVWSLFESPFPTASRARQLNQVVTSAHTTYAVFFGRAALFAVPLILMIAALFASQSRGAWLGFVLAGSATLIVRSKKAATLFLVALFLAGSAGALTWVGRQETHSASDNLFYVAVIQRFANATAIFNATDVATTPVTDANFATVERLAHWQAAQDMWRDNLWVGIGFGNYAAIYPAYAVGRWLDPLGHAHNYILNLGAETGLVGAIVYLIFWIWVFGVSWQAVRATDGFDRAVVAGGIGTLIHLHTHNLVDNLYVQGMYLHVAVVIGLIALIYLKTTARHQKTQIGYPVP